MYHDSSDTNVLKASLFLIQTFALLFFIMRASEAFLHVSEALVHVSEAPLLVSEALLQVSEAFLHVSEMEFPD